MITFVRTVDSAPGELGESLAFAKEVAAYIASNHGVELHVSVPVLGNPNRVAWETRYESLSDFERLRGRLMADKDYTKLIGKAVDLFIPGSLHDEMWQAV